MVGGVSMVGSSVVDSHSSPCLCLDALPTSTINLKSSGELRNSMKRKQLGRQNLVELGSSFVDTWHDSRLSSKAISGFVNRSCSRKQRKDRRMVVVSELAGQYEDSFDDVKKKKLGFMRKSPLRLQIQNYFTYKAVRTVLNQLYEMNPTKYRWLYDFVVSNKPGEGKDFLRRLVKERQDLGERVMVTRLHLYGKWIKKCNHAEIYEEISNENLELMRERLMETVIWPSDDSNTEKIG